MTKKTFEDIATKTNTTWILNLTKLYAIDPALHHRIIIYWLIIEHVSFPTTQSFFDELLRFLFSKKGGTHAIHPQWSIVKKQKSASIMSIL